MPDESTATADAQAGAGGDTSDSAIGLPLDANRAGPLAVGEDGEQLDVRLAEEREKYLRLAAEFDNYRKRILRERQEAGSRAQSELVSGLVEVLDDIMRFAHLDPTAVDSATVVQGVALVERKILKTLGAQGLELVNPVDQAFDPAFHEAVGTEPALSPEDDHMVARVYQVGYVFKGQMLRPARVVVKQWLD